VALANLRYINALNNNNNNNNNELNVPVAQLLDQRVGNSVEMIETPLRNPGAGAGASERLQLA